MVDIVPPDPDNGPNKASLDKHPAVSDFPMTAGGDDAVNSDSADGAWAVVAKDGKVLLVHRSPDASLAPGCWALPGGTRDGNEPLGQTAVRELLEETAISATLVGPSRLWPYVGGVCAAFALAGASGVATPDGREVTELAWFEPTALPGRLMPGTAEMIAELFPLANSADKAGPGGSNFQASREDSAIDLEVFRIDRVPLGKYDKTAEGFLRVTADATRVGVFTYVNPDGSLRRELRPPEEVFKEDSLATLASKPVTDEHPPGLLTSKTASAYSRGFTGESVTRNGQLVTVPMTVTDEALIRRIENKTQREASCGYACDLVHQRGTFEGQDYDAVQTNIRYNHLAVVRKGRAGPEVCLRLDAAEQQHPDDLRHDREEDEPMAKIRIDGVDYEVTEGVAAAYASQQRADAKSKKDMEEEMDAAKKAYDAKKAEFDAFGKKAKEDAKEMEDAKDKAQAKADSLQEQLAGRMDAAQVQTMVQARIRMERAATQAGLTKLDTMDDSQLKAAVIAKVMPDAKLDGKSEAYIDGRFDTAVEMLATRKDSSSRLADAVLDAGMAGGKERADSAAAEKMRNDSSKAWQQPIGRQSTRR